LSYINSGAVGIMIAVTLKLSYNFLFDWRYAFIMMLSIVISYFYKKISSIWIVIGGSIIGYVLSLVV
jgi:chromate transporter